MRTVIRDMKEITDSREIMEAKVNPFISIFIGFLLAMIVIGLIWASVSRIDIVVKASGVVRPNEKVSRIQNKTTGTVASVHFATGQKVKAGDILYTLESDAIDLEKQMVEADYREALAQYEELVQFKKMLEDGKNVEEFEQEEVSFHSRSSLTTKYPIKQKFQVEWIRLVQQLQNTEEKLEHLELLKRSMETGTNLLAPDSEYYYKFQDYQIKKEQYALQEETAAEFYKLTVRNGGEATEAAQKLQEIRLQANDYLNGFELSLATSLNETSLQFNKLTQDLDILFVQLNETVQAQEERVNGLKERLTNIEIALKDYIIVAPIDGTINALADINVGDVLMSGTELLTILPENDSEFRMRLALSHQDVANIKVGDKIKYSFAALPSKDYGTLEGTVRAISGDTVVNQQDGFSYYTVEADIHNKPLRNKKGEEAYIKTGMLAEAQIIANRETVLQYILKKINLDFRE